MTNLRDFGMGKKACEDKIIEESNVLIDVLKTFKGKRIYAFQSPAALDVKLNKCLSLFPFLKEKPST